MGMTLTTLHFYNLDRNEVEANLAPTDRIRNLNTLWLSVLPTNDAPIDDMNRLAKLAKHLTKSNDAVGLLFYYFDDESFFCSVYRGGKKTAECQSTESSWARFGKTLNTIFGDDIATKAFRYVTQCQSLEEQWRLLEETVGIALYDLQQEEPRRVKRGIAFAQEIKARDAALRKRPNLFVLTELPREAWPESARAKQALFELLRPQHHRYGLFSTFFPHIRHRLSIPGQKSLLAYGYEDMEKHRDRLILYDNRTGTITDCELPRGTYREVIWITPEGNPVILFLDILLEHIEQYSWGRSSNKGFVACLDKDGSELWRFKPDLEEYHLDHAHTSENGILTLYTTSGTTDIWQIDGRSGKVLRHRHIPEEHHLTDLNYVDALDAYVYATREPRDLIILDSKLEDKKRWNNYGGFQYIYPKKISGFALYNSTKVVNSRSAILFDLQNGTEKKIWLEIPAIVLALLPNGYLFAANEKNTAAIVFDSDGRVAARFPLKGLLGEVFLENGQAYLAEERGPNINGFYYDSLSDETSIHLWRLDPC